MGVALMATGLLLKLYPIVLKYSEGYPTTNFDWVALEKDPHAFQFDVDGVRYRMRYITPGSFMMGSPESDNEASDDEKPQHRVTLTKGFWLGETEVTQELWTAVLVVGNFSRFAGRSRPTEGMSWNDAREFITKLNAQIEGLNVRMPTEAEWEYAARAGSTESRYGELDAVAWCGANSHEETYSVGQKQPNAWGLYDMLGNVWEWTGDSFDTYPSDATTDPSVHVGGRRVLRGGSWRDSTESCRATSRDATLPTGSSHSYGLRLARSHTPTE